MGDRVNIAVRIGRITHETAWSDADSGLTRCRIPFFRGSKAVVAAEDAECDCMACIAYLDEPAARASAGRMLMTEELYLDICRWVLDEKDPM